MTFQVRLYIHHDNDLIQLYLNGIRLSDVFAKSLEAHYKKEEIQFEIPAKLELKPHKGKVYRIKVTLNEKKEPDLVRWVCAFPDQYKCHCIKNIARTYLGSSVIDALNGMAQAGTWIPDNGKSRKDMSGKTVRLREWKKKEDGKEPEWIDQVSATREKTEEQKLQMEAEKDKIRKKPIEEILGTRPSDLPGSEEENSPYHTVAGTAMAAQEPMPAVLADGDGGQDKLEPHYGPDRGSHPDTPQDLGGSGMENTALMNGAEDMGDQGGYNDFDVSLLFEQLRSQ